MNTATSTQPAILAFDASTNACSVALHSGNHIFFRHDIAPSQHAKLILPMIQALLLEAAITLKDVAAIAFGCGPGSFMGVRLATAMAQGLGFGVAIPLIPISTLQTLAQTALQADVEWACAHDATYFHDRNYLVAWDAKMHEIYWGFYAADQNGIMQPRQKDALCAPSAIDTHGIFEVPFAIAGNAWSVYAEQIPRQLLSQAITAKTDLYPDACAMITIAASKYRRNEIVSPENAHPHYLRHHVVHTTSK